MLLNEERRVVVSAGLERRNDRMKLSTLQTAFGERRKEREGKGREKEREEIETRRRPRSFSFPRSYFLQKGL